MKQPEKLVFPAKHEEIKRQRLRPSCPEIEDGLANIETLIKESKYRKALEVLDKLGERRKEFYLQSGEPFSEIWFSYNVLLYRGICHQKLGDKLEAFRYFYLAAMYEFQLELRDLWNFKSVSELWKVRKKYFATLQYLNENELGPNLEAWIHRGLTGLATFLYDTVLLDDTDMTKEQVLDSLDVANTCIVGAFPGQVFAFDVNALPVQAVYLYETMQRTMNIDKKLKRGIQKILDDFDKEDKDYIDKLNAPSIIISPGEDDVVEDVPQLWYDQFKAEADQLKVKNNKLIEANNKLVSQNYELQKEVEKLMEKITATEEKAKRDIQNIQDKLDAHEKEKGEVRRDKNASQRKNNKALSQVTSQLETVNKQLADITKERDDYKDKWQNLMIEKRKMADELNSIREELRERNKDQIFIRCEELERENEALNFYLASVTQGEDAVDIPELPEEVWHNSYPEGTVLFGGHESWQRHFAEKHPEVKVMVGVDTNFPDNVISSKVKLVLINIRFMPHKLYYKLKSLQRKKGFKIDYI